MIGGILLFAGAADRARYPDPEVSVEKYESLRNLLERVLWWPMRIRARARSRARYKVRQQAFAVTRNTLEGLAQLKAENHRIVFNAGLYLLLLDQDLADFTDHLVCAICEMRRVFIAKHEAILLHEAAEDATQLLGREFREAVKALGASDELLGRLNIVSSELNQF